MKIAQTHPAPYQPQTVGPVWTYTLANGTRVTYPVTMPAAPYQALPAVPADQWSKQQKLVIGAGAGGLGGVGAAMIFQALHGTFSHVPGLTVVLQAGELLIGGAAVGTAGGALWGAGMGGKQTVKVPGLTWTAEQPA